MDLTIYTCQFVENATKVNYNCIKIYLLLKINISKYLLRAFYVILAMNIKVFLLIKACHPLPSELIEHIWSFVKTDAKKTIQEKIQDMYYRKIELVRCLFLKLDSFANNNTREEYTTVFNTLKVYTKVANYMYIQDTERFIRRLYGIKWRYYNRYLSAFIDKMVCDITEVQLSGKARMARILALRTIDYNLSTQSYVNMTLSHIIVRMLTIMYNSLSDVKIPELDNILKFYNAHISDGIPIINNNNHTNMYSNPITEYLNDNLNNNYLIDNFGEI